MTIALKYARSPTAICPVTGRFEQDCTWDLNPAGMSPLAGTLPGRSEATVLPCTIIEALDPSLLVIPSILNASTHVPIATIPIRRLG